jgi:hypothetical protein
MPEVPIAGPDPLLAAPSPFAAGGSKPRPAAADATLLAGILKSLAAFERERESLFRTDPYRWVSYRDGNRLELADTQTELYRHCLHELCLGHEDFIVRCITPEEITEVEVSPR